MNRNEPAGTSLMLSKRLIYRHILLCVCFVPISLLLSLPDVILLARLGSVVWYPATALALALMLAVSPWYFLTCLADTLASALFYHQPLNSFAELLGTVATSGCCAGAAYLLRGPVRIDLGLRRQRDVLRYLFVTTGAGLVATLLGVSGLALDGTIHGMATGHLHWRGFPVTASGASALRPFSSSMCFPASAAGCLAAGTRGRPFRRSRSAPRHSDSRLGWKDLARPTDIPGAFYHLRTEVGGVPALLSELIPIIWIAMRQGIKRAVPD